MGSIGKAALITVQLIGLMLSAFLVTTTFTNPKQVEERLQNFAIAKVERAVDTAWTATGKRVVEGGRAERFGSLSRQIGMNAETIDVKRQKIVPALLANSVSDGCKETCEFWGAAAAIADSAMIERVRQLKVGQGTLQDFALERYETSVVSLIADLRQFGLVNIVVLSLMVALLLLRGPQKWQLVAFSVAITGYTAWAAYGYVVDQNWALSIILQDWAAPGYQAGMIIAACILADWLFLRCRISRLVSGAIGGILPC